MSLNLQDKQYLQAKKRGIVDGCKLCKGTNLNCSCYRRYFWELAKVDAAIPPKYRDFNLSKITAPESQPTVRKIASYTNSMAGHLAKGRGIYLWGNTGNAKTTLACIILMEALNKGYTAYFTDLIKCMDFITKGWNDEEVQADFGKKILSSQFLVIDDVGKEYKSKTGFMEAHFDMIFRERANNLLPTILTSNLAPSDIATDYGKRLYSIFSEHLITIETNVVDYRRKVIAKDNAKEITQETAAFVKTSNKEAAKKESSRAS